MSYCVFNARGYCRDGRLCNRSHDPMDVPLCRYFDQGVVCPYQKCWFRHIRKATEPDPRTKAYVSQLQNWQIQTAQASLALGYAMNMMCAGSFYPQIPIRTLQTQVFGQGSNTNNCPSFSTRAHPSQTQNTSTVKITEYNLNLEKQYLPTGAPKSQTNTIKVNEDTNKSQSDCPKSQLSDINKIDAKSQPKTYGCNIRVKTEPEDADFMPSSHLPSEPISHSNIKIEPGVTTVIKTEIQPVVKCEPQSPKMSAGTQSKDILNEITNKTSNLGISNTPITKTVQGVKPMVFTKTTKPVQKAWVDPKPTQNAGAISKKASPGSCPGKSKTGPCGINPKKGCSNNSCKKHCKEIGKKCAVHGFVDTGVSGGDENTNPTVTVQPQRKGLSCPGKDGSCTTAARKGCKNKMCIKCCTSTGKFFCPAHDKPAQEKGGRGRKEFDLQEHYMIWHMVKPSKTLKSQQDWDALLQSGILSKMRNLSFGVDFGIRDVHLETIAKHCKDLVVLDMGDEETGDGAWVTDQAVVKLAENCPKLIRLKMEAFTKVTDKALNVIFEKLQLLESLEISGNDKVSGKITKKGINLLLQRGMAPKLRHLETSNQHIDFEALEKLQKYRKNLKVLDEDRLFNDMDKWSHYEYGGFW